MRLRQNGRTERSLAADKGVIVQVGRAFRHRESMTSKPEGAADYRQVPGRSLTNAPAGAAATHRPRRHRRRSSRPGSEVGEDRSALAPSSRVRVLAGAPGVLPGWSATLPGSLFLTALKEGLPRIRPGAVDICLPMMVRCSVIYGVSR
jgi:hypothetical protein